MIISELIYDYSCSLFDKFGSGWCFTSYFCTMGSNGASRIETDGFWNWWDELDFWEGGSLGDLMNDNGLPLVWILKVNFSHGLPPEGHSRGDQWDSPTWKDYG